MYILKFHGIILSRTLHREYNTMNFENAASRCPCEILSSRFKPQIFTLLRLFVISTAKKITSSIPRSFWLRKAGKHSQNSIPRYGARLSAQCTLLQSGKHKDQLSMACGAWLVYKHTVAIRPSPASRTFCLVTTNGWILLLAMVHRGLEQCLSCRLWNQIKKTYCKYGTALSATLRWKLWWFFRVREGFKLIVENEEY